MSRPGAPRCQLKNSEGKLPNVTPTRLREHFSGSFINAANDACLRLQADSCAVAPRSSVDIGSRPRQIFLLSSIAGIVGHVIQRVTWHLQNVTRLFLVMHSAGNGFD